jgi:hypothetical protein
VTPKERSDAVRALPACIEHNRLCKLRKREVHCVNRKATASIAIKPAINNNEIVAATLFALGLSFHDRRP